MSASAGGRGGSGELSRRAFTLVELIVVVAIISVVSALAVPRLSRGATQAARAATQADWNLLQQQIDLFAEEHLGTFPASVTDGSNAARSEAAFVAHLTRRTNMNGEVGTTAGHAYGPYLRGGIPALKLGKFAGSNGVYVYAGAAAPSPDGNRAVGWIYNAQSGAVVPNVPSETIQIVDKGVISFSGNVDAVETP
ncbi:MAG: prepilin-type N-terminal cleavage/methylation domain-containing protein [Phycisphaerae bacterium]